MDRGSVASECSVKEWQQSRAMVCVGVLSWLTDEEGEENDSSAADGTSFS